MEKCREELKKNIYRDFRMFDPKTVISVDEMSETLRNACDVMDALGSEERDEFIEWIGSTQLQAYGAIFAPGGEKSGIEYLERRFEWLKNQLLKYNKNYQRIFPRYWNVPGNICREFCILTKKHLIEILKQSQQLNNLDMNDLVKALEQCVSFEKELQRLYSQPSFNDDLEKIKMSIKNLLGDYDIDDLYKEPMTAEKIKLRYKYEKLKKKLQDCESQISREQKTKSKEQKEMENIPDIDFVNILSSAFNKYMHYYVELERKSISDVLDDIRKNENWICDINNIPNEARYSGIDDLLGYIKSSIHRCAKIGTGDIFYKIYFEYKDGLKGYVDLLQLKVNQINSEIQQKNRNQRDISSELICLSLIVNTLDYLSDTLSALQGKLKNSMINERYAKKIDLKDIQEGKCDDLAANTVKAISQVITEKIGIVLDKEIPSCRKWNENEQSSDRSSFLLSLKTILNHDIAIVHEILVMAYHSLLNSQMSQRLIPKYTSCIFNRIKRISGSGALQLQLDTRDFEKTVLNLPNIGLTDDYKIIIQQHPNQGKTIRIPNAFTNNTKKQCNRIQALLKTINTPYSQQRLDDIATFFKDVSDKKGNAQDLSKICEIKGLSKREVQSVVHTYNRMIPTNTQSRPLISTQNNRNQGPDFLGDVFGRFRSVV